MGGCPCGRAGRACLECACIVFDTWLSCADVMGSSCTWSLAQLPPPPRLAMEPVSEVELLSLRWRPHLGELSLVNQGTGDAVKVSEARVCAVSRPM